MPRTKKPQKVKGNHIQNSKEEKNNEIQLFTELMIQEAQRKRIQIKLRLDEELLFNESIIKQINLSSSPNLLNQPYEKFFEQYLQGNSTIQDRKHLISHKEKGNKSKSRNNETFVKQDKRKLKETPKPTTWSASTATKPLFLTPAIVSNGKICPITPKIEPNEVITMLRHPRHGEVGISVNGSPLLVTSNQNHDLANVNIPLRDGNVISLIGQPGEVNVKTVCIDKKTTEQLKIIKRNLDIILEDQE